MRDYINLDMFFTLRIAMDFSDVIHKRRSIRSYKPDQVSDDVLNSLLESARLAPSWMNKQCWHFIIVNDPEAIQEIAGTTIINRWIKQAPICIVACADPHLSGTHHDLDYFTVDVAIAMEHLVLAATNQGLGTCWIGAINEKKLKTILQIPPRIRVVALTPIGYPEEKKRQVLFRTQKRKTISEFTHLNHW
jgi:nitroreductase